MSDSPHGPRVLIADDDPFIRSALASRLSNEFEIVACAVDATQAITLAGEHQPDVAIIDVQMPGGGGLRVVREMQTCAPRTAIVALSADESESDVRAFIEAGATAYVRKGAADQQLRQTLHRSMRAHAEMLTGVHES